MYKTFLKESKLQVGDTVRIKPEYQDSKDDGFYKVIEINGDRGTVQWIGRKLSGEDNKLKIVPTENVKMKMLIKEKEIDV